VSTFLDKFREIFTSSFENNGICRVFLIQGNDWHSIFFQGENGFWKFLFSKTHPPLENFPDFLTLKRKSICLFPTCKVKNSFIKIFSENNFDLEKMRKKSRIFFCWEKRPF